MVALRMASSLPFLCLTVNPRRLSCGLTPECVQISQVALSKESGGRKEAAQRISPRLATREDGAHAPTLCREEDKMSRLVLGDSCWCRCCCRHGDW